MCKEEEADFFAMQWEHTVKKQALAKEAVADTLEVLGSHNSQAVDLRTHFQVCAHRIYVSGRRA